MATAPAPLLQLVLGDTQATYAYPAAPSPYRYVRLRSGLLSLLCVDAIEALAAAGPTATAAPSSTLASTATHAASATPLLSASPSSTSLPGPSATPSATLSSILLSASAAPLNTATPAPRQPSLTPAAFTATPSAPASATALPGQSAASPSAAIVVGAQAAAPTAVNFRFQQARVGLASASSGGWLGYMPWLLLSLVALGAPGWLIVATPARLRVSPVLASEEQGLRRLQSLGLATRQRLALRIKPRSSMGRAAAQFVRGESDVLLGSLHDIIDLAESGTELRIIYVHACSPGALRLVHGLRVMAVTPQTLATRAAHCERLVRAWSQLVEQPAPAHNLADEADCVLLGRKANRALLLEQGGARMQRLIADALGRPVKLGDVRRLCAYERLQRGASLPI
ncbi:MAG: hypothetical protein KIT29_00425 [Anaerolineales bacterium]|nr:hypothetical protein [Anaerolineales bacterium]